MQDLLDATGVMNMSPEGVQILAGLALIAGYSYINLTKRASKKRNVAVQAVIMCIIAFLVLFVTVTPSAGIILGDSVNLNIAGQWYAIIAYAVVGIVLLVSICILLAWLFMRYLESIGVEANAKITTLALSAYALLVVNIKIPAMFTAQGIAPVLSAIGVLFGMYWIIRGFSLSFKAMRITGVVTSVLFLIKVGTVDIWHLNAGIKPIVYILLAGACFGIVYAYTYLSKKKA